ncbi:helix-turn-helix transcriptional regulator [Streptomyces sp. MS06]|uniref:helix-turn-helix transcriptional regulator n=1 Tax=Streptomyces sp. MS06 TaxID=3385974 RepID=UPI0039A1E2CC
MNTLEFDSDDLERTEEFFNRVYTRMRIGSGTSDSTTVRVRRVATESVSVDELDVDFDMDYSVTPLGRICLCRVHEGSIRDHALAGGEGTSFAPGDMVSFAPPDVPYSGRICSARYNVTMLRPELLSQVAATAEQRAPQPVRLTGHRPYSESAARRLSSTILYLRDHVLADPGTAAQPLVAATAEQHLAAGVLAAFPSTALTEPTASDRNDAHPATLRRATAHIDDHVDQPLTVADIAAAAHVTVRAVQYAFRRHLDTTPLGYLRQVRLAYAHRELAAADRTTGATVTGIAARWGFYHPGRFAALYRGAYGRPPRQTLDEAA